MKISKRRWLVWPVFLAVILVMGAGCAGLQKTEKPDWMFHDIVDVQFVQQYAMVPQPKGVMVIDSRPYKPKFVNGHIPSAVSIPDSQFDKHVAKLPAGKDSLLIFYCGGPTWKLSHKSARRAEKLGYNDVKVFADGFPAWIKKKGNFASVEAEYVAKQIETNEVMVIDSRPKKAKYDKGHVPSAISIPDSDFEKLSGKLPRDKNTALIFYCQGYTWKLSHNSARKAVKLGYKNVTVFSSGYPAWVKAYGAGASAVAVKAGEEEGTIDIAAFKKILQQNPQSIYLIDVRDPDEYAGGHFSSAVNIPVNDLEKKVQSLPADRPIVFVCSTGARSGESFYMLKDLRPELKEVFYVEAEITFDSQGAYQIKPTQ